MPVPDNESIRFLEPTFFRLDFFDIYHNRNIQLGVIRHIIQVIKLMFEG